MAKWVWYLCDRLVARSPAGRRRHARRSISLTGFFLLALTGAALAADGRDLVENGNGKGAPQCSACHGARGEGRPDAAYPRLAGIDARYLLRQLNDFADGNRDSQIMHPIAKALDPDERQAVASFYATLWAPKISEPKKPDDKTIGQGAHLAVRGNWSKGLPACGQCHGPSGQGVGGSFPRLAGQSAEYIVKELKAWKEGKRSNDPMNLMTGVASKLGDGEVLAVAAYYSSLPVPDAEPLRPEGAKP